MPHERAQKGKTRSQKKRQNRKTPQRLGNAALLSGRRSATQMTVTGCAAAQQTQTYAKLQRHITKEILNQIQRNNHHQKPRQNHSDTALRRVIKKKCGTAREQE